MAYTKNDPAWSEGEAPGISAARLNHLETQYDEGKDDLDAHKVLDTGVHGAGEDTLATDAEIDADIAAHKALPNDHHPQSHSAASHSDITSSGANIDDAVAKKHAQAHTLASHSTKAHSELTGVTASQHHAKYTNGEAIAAAKTDNALLNPSGMIVMWHGTIGNIPTGWVICDGNNSTPNLLTKFVQGVATAATNPGATGGATQKELDNIGAASLNVGSTKVAKQTSNQGLYAHSGSASLYQAGYEIADIRPTYYDVAFIMKS